MAKIVTKERFEVENPVAEMLFDKAPLIPVWGYGVEADSYEEAKALATAAFKTDFRREVICELLGF